GLDQTLGAGARPHLLAPGDEAVEAHPAGIRRHLEVDHGRSSPGEGSGSTGGGAWDFLCSTRIRPRASSATPITMKLSARLKVGQWVMWMKSVTWPSRMRSARFETLPPTSSPSATGKSTCRDPERAKCTSIHTTAAAVRTETMASLPGKMPNAIPLFRTCVIVRPGST